MTKKTIHVLLANPSEKSLGHAIAMRYVEAAQQAGHTVTFTHIAKLKFDYNLWLDRRQEMEADLLKEQELIGKADHVVLVTPMWWYALPASAKAYFDRVFTPGFAYKYPHPIKPLRPFLPRRLLKGKSMRVITTQDSFFFVSWVIGLPVRLSMRVATFWYVGLWPVRVTKFTRVRFSSDTKRFKWLKKTAKLASRAK